ncbi:MAG: hypothetical protein Q8O13_03075 [Candidatus Omnitrophota bacterium]|nr:hypothetical protein [Candidatus Omnitrophota bacterium]
MIWGILNSLPMFLATATLGYFVCIKANKELGLLRALGMVLGILVIVITLLSSMILINLSLIKPGERIGRLSSQQMGTRPIMPKQDWLKRSGKPSKQLFEGPITPKQTVPENK